MFGSPYQRGFFCGDESIRYPFKESTVSSSILYTVGLGLPTLVVSNNLPIRSPDVSSMSINVHKMGSQYFVNNIVGT